VTGYLQNTDGWNPGKRQELLDRYRDTRVGLKK
jgi:anaerobic ribonucleoside-triphosphate reductase